MSKKMAPDTMSKAERRVVRAAMRYYNYWNRSFAVKPAATNGQFPSEITLYNACVALQRERGKR